MPERKKTLVIIAHRWGNRENLRYLLTTKESLPTRSIENAQRAGYRLARDRDVKDELVDVPYLSKLAALQAANGAGFYATTYQSLAKGNF